jgi:hypothetical protein
MDSIDGEADIIFVQEYVKSYSITPHGISSTSDLMPLMITRGKGFFNPALYKKNAN